MLWEAGNYSKYSHEGPWYDGYGCSNTNDFYSTLTEFKGNGYKECA